MKLWKIIVAGLLVAVFALGCSGEEEDVRVNCLSCASPVIQTDAASLEFGEPQSEGVQRRKVRVSNAGGGTLRISSVRIVQESDQFQLGEDWQGSAELATDEFIDLEVLFVGERSEAETATLVIESNDPDLITLSIPIVGPSEECLEVDVDELDFGVAGRAEEVTRTATVENCSTGARAEIRDVIVDGEAFGTTWSVDGPFILAAGDTAQVRVTFESDAPGAFEGKLRIMTNSESEPEFLVDLNASIENQCPVAVAKGSIGNRTPSPDVRTIPLNDLQLHGDESYDPDGDAITYSWRVVERSTDASQILTPGDDAPNPSVLLDLAGLYEYELTVTDEYGLESCEPALVNVSVACDCGIHVQLVWDTPADEDQTDDVGTNLDLHYAQEGAPWHDPLLDAHAENPSPDWGANGPADDPSLDFDDTDGAGPENINHVPGESSAEFYTVGVHYQDENGFGPSYATVRIFVDAVLVYEQRDKYLDSEDQFWTVARIQWPSGTIEDVDELSRP